VEDSIGRLWQLGTCQLDFSMPARFEATFIGEDGAAHTPVMIHRAILGSVERFLGVLIEHFGGAFPFWLAPEQIRLVNIVSSQDAYLGEVETFLREKGYRVSGDTRNEKLGAKIRASQLAKIPYTVIIGDKEVESKTLSLRPRQGDQVSALSWDDLVEQFEKTELNPLK